MQVMVLEKKDILSLRMDPEKPAVLVEYSPSNRIELRTWAIYNIIFAKPIKHSAAWKNKFLYLPTSWEQLPKMDQEVYKKLYDLNYNNVNTSKIPKLYTYHPLGKLYAIALAIITARQLKQFDPNKTTPFLESPLPDEEFRLLKQALEPYDWSIMTNPLAIPEEYYKKIAKLKIYKYSPRELFEGLLPINDHLPSKAYTLDPRVVNLSPNQLKQRIHQELQKALKTNVPNFYTIIQTHPQVMLQVSVPQKEHLTLSPESARIVTILIGSYPYKSMITFNIPNNDGLRQYLKDNTQLLKLAELTSFSLKNNEELLPVITKEATIEATASNTSLQRTISIQVLPLVPAKKLAVEIRDTFGGTSKEPTTVLVRGLLDARIQTKKHKYRTTFTIKAEPFTVKFSTSHDKANILMNTEVVA